MSAGGAHLSVSAQAKWLSQRISGAMRCGESAAVVAMLAPWMDAMQRSLSGKAAAAHITKGPIMQ
jgi:hypothetical protein